MTDLARLEERLAALDRLCMQLFEEHEQKDDLKFQSIDKRMEQLNRFREQASEERALYLRRDAYEQSHVQLQDEIRKVADRGLDRKTWETQHEALSQRVGSLERFFSENVGRDVGVTAAQQRLYVIGGLLFAAVSIIVTVLLATHG